ncbi:MAG: hypothetical protein MSD82_12405 [Prevotella sp.]|nr:hypothetical protein [Prevotella sp.]
MAKYTINYRCGHTEKVALFGKYADRENHIKSLEADDCPACKLAARLAKANLSDIALVGSDKQIVWAADIRAKFIEASNVLKDLAKGKENEPQMQSLLAFLETTKNNTDAKFWIDNRDSLTTYKAVFSFYQNNK